MPIDVHILQGGVGQVWVCHGVLLGNDFIANTERMLSSGGHEGIRWLLVDVTDSTVAVLPEDIRTIKAQGDQFAALVPELVNAVVVPHDYAFAMTRMEGVLTGRPGWSVRAFRGRAEAETWLREEVRRKFGIEVPGDLTTP